MPAAAWLGRRASASLLTRARVPGPFTNSLLGVLRAPHRPSRAAAIGPWGPGPRIVWCRSQGGSPELGADPSTQEEGTHQKWMATALEEARKGLAEGEVPVGAVLVDGQELVCSAHNQTEALSDPTAHAEMLCIREGARRLGWRLTECSLYVTLEPCPMCGGAVLQARLKEVIYGARSPLLGADGSWIAMLPCSHDAEEAVTMEEQLQEAGMQRRPHPFHPDMRVVRGVMEDDCATIMKEFFSKRRLESSAQYGLPSQKIEPLASS